MNDALQITNPNLQNFSVPIAPQRGVVSPDIPFHTTRDELVNLLLIQTVQQLKKVLEGSTPVEPGPSPQPPAFEVLKDLPATAYAVNPEHVALILLNTKPNGNSVKVSTQASATGATLTPIGSSAVPAGSGNTQPAPAPTPAPAPIPTPAANFLSREEFTARLAQVPTEITAAIAAAMNDPKWHATINTAVNQAVTTAMNDPQWQTSINATVNQAVGTAIQGVLADGGALDQKLQDALDDELIEGGKLSGFIETHISDALEEATRPEDSEDDPVKDPSTDEVPNGLRSSP